MGNSFWNFEHAHFHGFVKAWAVATKKLLRSDSSPHKPTGCISRSYFAGWAQLLRAGTKFLSFRQAKRLELSPRMWMMGIETPLIKVGENQPVCCRCSLIPSQWPKSSPSLIWLWSLYHGFPYDTRIPHEFSHISSSNLGWTTSYCISGPTKQFCIMDIIWYHGYDVAKLSQACCANGSDRRWQAFVELCADSRSRAGKVPCGALELGQIIEL